MAGEEVTRLSLGILLFCLIMHTGFATHEFHVTLVKLIVFFGGEEHIIWVSFPPKVCLEHVSL